MWLVGLLLFTVVFFGVTGIAFLGMNEPQLPFWEKLPRNRTAGGLAGLAVLLAFIPNVRPLFQPEDHLYWLIPAAVILAFLGYRYLDHLLARTAAAAVILLAHRLLADSYSADLNGEAFFALMCFLWGTYGIVIAAKPYWLRDSFRFMCRNWRWRVAGGAAALLWAASAAVLLVQYALKALKGSQ